MNRLRDFVPDALDLVADLEFFSLEGNDGDVVGGGVRDGVGELIFQGLMLPLELRKMRLN